MQTVQLYINDQRVDLFNDENISVNSSIQNVKDISKIFTDFSQTFTIPASKTNNKLFKHYDDSSILDGFDARFRADARIELNNVPFRKGSIRLNKVIKKEGLSYAYNITFFGSIAALNKILGTDKLKDLTDELSIYDHDWTYDNILDGLQTGLTVGTDSQAIIYPLISPDRRFVYDSNAGYTPLDNTANIALSTDGIRPQDLKPAIRVIRIIEAIEARYPQIKFSRDFFSKNIFNDLYLWLHRNSGEILSATGKSERIISNFAVNTEDLSCGDYYAFFSNDYFETSTGGDTSFGTDTSASLTITPVDLNTEYTFKIVDLITDTVLEERTGTGILGKTIDLGEWFEAPQFWRIQVQISTEDSITLNTYSARWEIFTNYYVNAAIDCVNYQDYRVVDQPMLSRIITANQMPDIKILDFLTGIFKMFNLTSYVEDTDIIVEDLNTFYEDYQTWDITDYVSSDNVDVNRVPLYSEVNFEYQEPKTFLSKEFSETNGSNFGEEKYIVTSLDNEFIDGGEYKVELPFEKVIYERLNDEDDAVLTNAQYGYFVNDKQEKELGSPLLFLNVNQDTDTKSIYFVSRDGLTSNSLTTYNRPSNVASDNLQTINFSAEIDEWLRDTNENSLFKTYYESYISNVFNKRNRLTSLTAFLPFNILTKYNLSDRFKIGDQEYRINTIQTELTSGKSTLELLSIITDEFTPAIITCPTADSTEVTVDSTVYTVDCGDEVCATADSTNVTVDNDSLTVDCGDPIPTTTTTTSTTTTTTTAATTTAGTTTTAPTTTIGTTTTAGTTTTLPTTTTTATPCVQRISYSGIPTQSIEVGGNKTINLDTYFTQLDGQPLSYLAINSTSYLDSVSLNGSQLTMFANTGNSCGTDGAGVYVQAYDSISGNCEYGTYFGIDVFGCTVETTTTTTTIAPIFLLSVESLSIESNQDSITFTARVTNAGSPPYTTRGVYYVEGTGTPTASDNVVTISGTDLNPYQYILSGLPNGVTYSFVGWATNTNGTAVSEKLTATTTNITTTTQPTTTTTSTTTTTTIAPTTPVGTINNTFVSSSGTSASFDVYTIDANDTYIDFIIYPTDGGSYSERQVVPTVNGTVVNWLISWKDDVDTTNGGTGTASLVVTNNLGTEFTLDSDSFVIPAQ